MYVKRTIEDFIKKAERQSPVLLITGPRQVGKTTLLKHLSSKERTYVTLDDPLILGIAREDPALFMKRFRPPLFIDEIQYAPGLLPYIKINVDIENKKGMYWLTGSQQFHMMKEVSESLAGRVSVVDLLGLSLQEMRRQRQSVGPYIPEPEAIRKRVRTAIPLTLLELYKRIWRGSFPAVALDEDIDRDLYYGSYVQTYLQRDIRDLARVGDALSFMRFMRACAARTGQMLNMAELARDTGITLNTVKSWISILQASSIVYLLEPYHTNVTTRLIKTPKLYILDTGLAAYLTEWSSPATLEAGAMSGAILETWIMSELIKSYWHNGRQAPFYYYRDKDQKEIDLLILQNGTIYPLEFKKSASPTRDMVRHFKVLDNLGLPVGPSAVICLVDQALPLTQTSVTVPAWSL